MVDVSEKAESARTAVARGRVLMAAPTLEMIRAGAHKKGDVLAVARLAGVMAAKRTADLIPLCHPLMLSKASVEFSYPDDACAVEIEALVKVTGQTGVEMEALTA
ncbi:MAG: cyclic pyranopterin monophosphate synthase MoaC, partial [Pseudomonadota bacterium]